MLCLSSLKCTIGGKTSILPDHLSYKLNFCARSESSGPSDLLREIFTTQLREQVTSCASLTVSIVQDLDMAVPSLRELLQGYVAELVVKEGSPCLAIDLAASLLLLSLDQGAWGTESKAVLDRVVQRYTHKLTPRIVLALLPSGVTTLSLKECPLVTDRCINQIIERCPNLQSLNLAGNSEINFREIYLFKENSGTVHPSLAHISLEDCQVENHIVQALLKNVPMLQSLNIARCHITDTVFLLNETKQLAREGGMQHPFLDVRYDCQLQSLDVTGCSEFSSTGVRHLCTLCGPSLRVLNMSWTKVDSTSLVYLSGLGLPAVVQFYLPLDTEGGDSRQKGKPWGCKSAKTKCEVLLETLAQFEQISSQLRLQTQMKVNAEYLKLQDLDTDIVENNHNTSQEHSCSSSLNLEKNSAFNDHDLPISPNNVDDGSCEGVDTAEPQYDSSHCSKEIRDDTLQGLSCVQTEVEFAPPLSEHGVFSDQEQGNTTKDSSAPQKDSSKSADLSKVSETATEDKRDKACTRQTEPFFTPNIKELCISGAVFSDAPASLSCLHQFLESNSGLSTLRLMGGLDGHSVTDEVLGQVTEVSRALKHVVLEGCVHLTTAGVAGLAACKHLQHLDLTGVAFVEDAGLIYLIKKLPLTSLLLAETRVKNKGLMTLASQPNSHKLEELELSWCEDLEDDEGLNAVARSCFGLRRLILRECGLSTKTMELIAANCRNLRELSLACCDSSMVCDESVILVSQNLASLEAIDLSWNSNLSNMSIQALISNCHQLAKANLSGLKRITAEPFADIIAVPEELSSFLDTKKMEWEENEQIKITMCDLPCVPHRSTVYGTHLAHLELQYSDFVADEVLNDIVAITMGAIKIVDYYGSEVTISEGLVEAFVISLFQKKCFQNPVASS